MNLVINGLVLILVAAMNESMSVPSGDVMSSGHHDLDLALKSPKIIVKEG